MKKRPRKEKSKSPTSLEAWSDGSGGKIGLVGCGVVIVGGETLREIACIATDDRATCNRAEMFALLITLHETPPHIPLIVYSDSQIVVKGFDGTYGRRSNTDLWEAIDLASRGRSVTLLWTRGHDRDTNNRRADDLARGAVTMYRATEGSVEQEDWDAVIGWCEEEFPPTYDDVATVYGETLAQLTLGLPDTAPPIDHVFIMSDRTMEKTLAPLPSHLHTVEEYRTAMRTVRKGKRGARQWATRKVDRQQQISAATAQRRAG